MKIQWHTADVPVHSEWRTLAEGRVHSALGRFSQRIARVDLYIRDENCPRRSVDKNCQLIAKLVPYGTIAVQDRDANLDVLIERGVDRLARSVRRELDRRRTLRASG